MSTHWPYDWYKKFGSVANYMLTYWDNNRDLYRPSYPIRKPKWALLIDPYRGPCNLMPPEQFKSEVTENTLGNLNQMIGYSAFNDYLTGVTNQGLLTKEDLLKLLLQVNHELMAEKAGYNCEIYDDIYTGHNNYDEWTISSQNEIF